MLSNNIFHKENTLNQTTVNKVKKKKHKNIIDDKSEEKNGLQLKEKKDEENFKRKIYHTYCWIIILIFIPLVSSLTYHLIKRKVEGKIKTIKYDYGFIYEGEIKDGKRHGYGIFYIGNEYLFEGKYKDDKRDGFGIEEYINGDIFEGEFKDDIRNGYGIEEFNDGVLFEGEFKDYKRNGFGIEESNDGDIFEGEFKNDKRNGFGIEVYNNGDLFEGKYKDDKRDGFGIEEYINWRYI